MWSDSYQYFYDDFIACLIFDLVNQRQFSISVDDKVILFCFIFLYFSGVPRLVVYIITAGVVMLMAVILCTTKKHW